MGFQDSIRKYIANGFLTNDMPTSQVIAILAVSFLIGLYIYFIYRVINKSGLYNRNFHTAMSVICVITAGIIIAMQSSLVISLGMVGALSIVRFRTAIKDTLDLMFLFWSIGEGIICGAGLFKIALLLAVVVTLGIFVLEYIPGTKNIYLMIINANAVEIEDSIITTIKNKSNYYAVKSRNIKKNGFDIIVELRTKDEKELIKCVGDINGVEYVSLVSKEGEYRV